MNAKTLLTLVLFTTVFTNESRAAVMSRDWKTPGDGLLTYDDVNQRGWLDLGETLLVNFASNPENVFAETGPEGLFEHFQFADSSDVLALVESAGIDTTSVDITTNGASTLNLATLLGLTVQSSSGSKSAFGLIDNFPEPPEQLSNQLVAAIAVLPSFGHAGLSFVPYARLTDRPSSITGVMFFRNIPEPSACLLVLCGTCLLLLTRYKQHKLLS